MADYIDDFSKYNSKKYRKIYDRSNGKVKVYLRDKPSPCEVQPVEGAYIFYPSKSESKVEKCENQDAIKRNIEAYEANLIPTPIEKQDLNNLACAYVWNKEDHDWATAFRLLEMALKMKPDPKIDITIFSNLQIVKSQINPPLNPLFEKSMSEKKAQKIFQDTDELDVMTFQEIKEHYG